LATLAALGLFSKVYAGIKTNGLWSDYDYYDDTLKIGVENGVPYSNDTETIRRIEAATTVDGDANDYL
jgi:hypothetical protein